MAMAIDGLAGALTIKQMARRSGFSEPTLRYYEEIGLLGKVDRDASSGHRRYGPETAARVEALSCLRSAGMTVTGMRRYLDLIAQGDAAAAELRELFTTHAATLAAQIDQLQLSLRYLQAKARMWDARFREDSAEEDRAVADVMRVLEHLIPEERTE